MKSIFVAIKGFSRFLYYIAGAALTSIMALTVFDVILRKFKRPIDFTYEVVVLLGAIVIGFSLPQTTLEKGHVLMDFLIEKLPQGWQKTFNLITRFLGIVTFGIIGWNILLLGNNLRLSGQISPILEIPEFPVAYGVGICCFVECLVLFYDLLRRLEEVQT